jgi:type II restriction enzyme
LELASAIREDTSERGLSSTGYSRLKPLALLKLDNRGWTLDVLNAVRSLNKSQFDLAEIYAFEQSLARLHPKNLHVRDKIRQQLQALRDLDILEFLGGGSYKLRKY